jgi:hypothetical protein
MVVCRRPAVSSVLGAPLVPAFGPCQGSGGGSAGEPLRAGANELEATSFRSDWPGIRPPNARR